MQKLLLCCSFARLDFPLKNKLRQTGCSSLLTLTENYTFSKVSEKLLGATKLLFKVSQGFNNFFGGRKLGS